MSFSEFTQSDYEVIERDYALLKEAARKRCASEEELQVVQKAFDFANEAHRNVRRRSGEPYILHPIAVAKIVVSDIGLGYKSISAALLHDVVEDTDYTVEDIRKLFGDKIASLVEGLTKIKNVLDSQAGKDEAYTRSLQAENFKRILLTLGDDVRVVLIKLADRLHNCRTIEFMPEYKRDKILSETMFIFVPLAHRLGLYEIKSEMENIWLRYKEPDAYAEISDLIDRNLSDKKKEIDRFIIPVEEALEKAGFQFEIRKRVKTPYSIWHKMQTKNISFEEVYDLYAIRIIFTPDSSSNESERDQCYHIFSIITGIYKYKPERVRDWVKHPKSNGYEALHCTLLSDNGVWIEVQIRTKRMDDIAEKGIAAHWAYKKDGYVSENDSEMDKWLDKVKDIISNPDVGALELLEIIHNDLVSSDIVVFTPKGDQKSVQKGATALDLAYQIHTDIGHQAIAAKVNMKLVPLSYVLRSGDQVEIITAEDERPKKEWLHFLYTRHARNAVMDYFRADRAQMAKAGRDFVQEQLKAIGIHPSDGMFRRMALQMEVGNADELFFRYSLGLIPFDAIVDMAGQKPVQQTKRRWTFPWSKKDAPAKPKYILASCCKPIPGDAIVAFKQPDGTISVHKKSCNVAESIASKHGDWIVTPQWEEIQGQDYLVRISIRGTDRVGLLNEITRYISLVMGINMKKMVLGSEEGIFEGYLDLFVHDKDVLTTLMGKISGISGIERVMRTEL